MAEVSLAEIEKVYPNGHAAVRGIDLAIADGEFLVLVGPSGCGKSTLLRLVAGLETATRGRISIGGRDVTGVPPQDRDIAMVFQNYALYPHMTVRRNLEYGLRVRGTARADVDASVGRVSRALGLDGLLDRRPSQLSGGQRQRVALGRAMVRDPKVFLLDEPLSNLDPALRTQARAELLQLHRSLQATIIYVTHDQEEAMTLGTRVAVMRDGRVEQLAPPMELYAKPANTFVAQFIGSPAMNLLPASLWPSFPPVAPPDPRTIGIRPHDIVLGDSGPLRATVDIIEPRGHDMVVHLTLRDVPHATIVAVVADDARLKVDSVVNVSASADRIHRFSDTGGRMG